MDGAAVILVVVIVLLGVAVAGVLPSGRGVKRWDALVGRELKRRNLVRVPNRIGTDVDLADGYQLIETCRCERDGRLYDVFVFLRRPRSRGLARLLVDEHPAV